MSFDAINESVMPITGVQFSILGGAEILRMSVIDGIEGIQQTELYDGQTPRIGGLVDPRLGTMNRDNFCVTCGLDKDECVGHFGHSKLAEPVFHIGYLPYLKSILGCICLKCSKLLVNKNTIVQLENIRRRKPDHRLKEMVRITKNANECKHPNGGCGTPVKKIEIENSGGVIAMYLKSKVNVADTDDGTLPADKKAARPQISAALCYGYLSQICDEDVILLGMDPSINRPEMMVQDNFAIPPIHIRPSIKREGMNANSAENDLTHKLLDIIKASKRINATLKNQSEQVRKHLPTQINLLQCHTGGYFDAKHMGMKCENRGKVTKSLTDRIKGKEGRVRSNLMGKRVDFSGRTVITPDPNISVDEIGVPLKIARNLTIDEIVTEENYKFLSDCVKNKREYPGANFIKKYGSARGGRKVSPQDTRFIGDYKLRIGDIVSRHLRDGDLVLFNRQPSLHKMSMMAHRVKVINNEDLCTFRINLAATSPYNADCDGDEMNIFVPQCTVTMLELQNIASVINNIISPRHSTPAIGIMQDSSLGAYNLTDPDLVLDWKIAMNLLSNVGDNQYATLEKGRTYTGPEVFSKIIPEKINIDNGSIVIQNGELKKGRIGKSMIGPKVANTIHHQIHIVYDQYKTRTFLDDVQRLTNTFNLYRGFTVGTADMKPDAELDQKVYALYENKKLEILHLITEMEKSPNFMDAITFERIVSEDLNTMRDESGKLLTSHISKDNNFAIMMAAESNKGSASNFSQMRGFVGQQTIEGGRALRKVNGRSIYYFPRDDDSPRARGFVAQSYLYGLDPASFIFHCMTSREGMIDTAVKTAETGYMARKLIKLMEDLQVKYDLTVRTFNNFIIQFVYGDTGADTTKQYQNDLASVLKYSTKSFLEAYEFSNEELQERGFGDYKELQQEHIKEITELRNKMRFVLLACSLDKITVNYKIYLPVNVRRVVELYKQRKPDGKAIIPISPKDIIDKIKKLLTNQMTTLLPMTKKDQQDPMSIKNMDERLSKLSLSMAINSELSPKKLLNMNNIGVVEFNSICRDISNMYNGNIVQAGEMVGIIAAQSIGEPITQMCCKSNTRIKIMKNIRKRTGYEDVDVETVYTYYDGEIGQFVDTLLYRNLESVKTESNVSLLDVSKDSFLITSVSELGEISTKPLQEVSRLPAGGKLVKIVTQSGKTVTTTLCHAHLTMDSDGLIVKIRADELKVGSKIPTTTTDVGVLAWEQIIQIVLEDDPLNYVYDFSVKDNNTFLVNGGIFIHNTLSSFHSAGVGVVVEEGENSGVSRIKELLGVSKSIKTPMMYLHISDEYVENKPIVEKIMSTIRHTVMDDIISKIEVYYDPNPNRDSGLTKEDGVYVYGATLKNVSKSLIKADMNNLPWLIRVILDKEQLLDKSITLADIRTKYVNLINMQNSVIDKKVTNLLNNVVQSTILTNSTNSPVPVVHIRLEMKEYSLAFLSEFIEDVVKNFKLKGFSGIKKTYSRKQRRVYFDKENEEEKIKDQFIIITSGISLNDVKYINGINLNTFTCNDVIHTMQTLGLEAGLKVLNNELLKVFVSNKATLNPQHTSLAISFMSAYGTLHSLDRHSLNKTDGEPISRASFEKTGDQLLKAAMFNELDHVSTVSSAIALGQAIKAGTGFCEVMIDTDLIENSEYTDNFDKKYINSLEEDQFITSILESKNPPSFILE